MAGKIYPKIPTLAGVSPQDTLLYATSSYAPAAYLSVEKLSHKIDKHEVSPQYGSTYDQPTASYQPTASHKSHIQLA